MAEESKTVEFLEICTLERKEWSRSLTVMSDAKCYSSSFLLYNDLSADCIPSENQCCRNK